VDVLVAVPGWIGTLACCTLFTLAFPRQVPPGEVTSPVWCACRCRPGSAVIANSRPLRPGEEPLVGNRRDVTPRGQRICLMFPLQVRQKSQVPDLHGEPLQRQTRHWVIGSRTWRCGSP
jgi:hypothetical protein